MCSIKGVIWTKGEFECAIKAKRDISMSDISWANLETEYITGDIAAEELAKKYGISYYTLRKHAQKDNWFKKKKEYRNKTIQKACNKAMEKKAGKLANMIVAADGLSSLIARTVKKVNALDAEEDRTPVDAKMISDLTKATRDLTSIIRELYDLPTENERIARKIALERLKLDQAKSDVTNNDVRIEVTLDGELEEYVG